MTGVLAAEAVDAEGAEATTTEEAGRVAEGAEAEVKARPHPATEGRSGARGHLGKRGRQGRRGRPAAAAAARCSRGHSRGPPRRSGRCSHCRGHRGSWSHRPEDHKFGLRIRLDKVIKVWSQKTWSNQHESMHRQLRTWRVHESMLRVPAPPPPPPPLRTDRPAASGRWSTSPSGGAVGSTKRSRAAAEGVMPRRPRRRTSRSRGGQHPLRQWR